MAKVERLPYGSSIEGLNQFSYSEQVLKAKIDKFGKFLLLYFSLRYNFEKNKPCYASQRTIERELHLSRGTYGKWKNYLEELEWLGIQRRTGTSNYVFVQIGKDDPKIKPKNLEKQDELSTDQDES